MDDPDNRMLRFEEYYRYLEWSFNEITRIIPLENHPDTFSPRLYEILQSTCSQIEGIARIMHEACFSKSDKVAAALYADLDHEGVLSNQKVAFRTRTEWNAIKPFSCDFACIHHYEHDDPHMNPRCGKMPKWWTAYNDSKHRLPDGYVSGSVGNAYLALAGLYVLHVMMYQLQRNPDGFLRKDSWKMRTMSVIHGHRNTFHEWAMLKPRSDMFLSLGMLVPKQT